MRIGGLRVEQRQAPIAIDEAHPRFSWSLMSQTPATMQTAFRVLVASDPTRLATDRGDLWDSGRISSAETVGVAYQGQALEPGQRCHWKVGVWTDQAPVAPVWSQPASWEMGLLGEAGWEADWIGRGSGRSDAFCSLLARTEFELQDRPVAARAYVAGLGVHVLHINGHRIGDRVLDPALTDYTKRILYVTHDVTEYLRPGRNAIGVALGRGWFGSPTQSVWFWEQAPWWSEPMLRLLLRTTGPRGERQVVASDTTWRVNDGPTLRDSVFCGEEFDRRRDPVGWTSVDFRDDGWEDASVVRPPGGQLVADAQDPARVTETLKASFVSHPLPGTSVYDFGEALAGWSAVKVTGPRGARVALRHGEHLDRWGRVDVRQRHVQGDLQTDAYLLGGDGVEHWEPQFTYKGFRYVEAWADRGVQLRDLQARRVHTDLRSIGSFECSHDLVNEIHEATRRSLISNFHGLPTDSPTYEKSGWTGDARLTAPAAAFNFEAAAFYAKWMEDLADAQLASGEVPTIVPTSGWSYQGSGGWKAVEGPTPAWDAAYFVIPLLLYDHYGDRRSLERAYPMMRRYLGWVGRFASEGVIMHGLGDWNAPGSDGLPPEGATLSSTAHYAHLFRLAARTADLLNRPDEADVWRSHATMVREAFNRRFWDATDRRYRTQPAESYRQTSNILALAFGLVPDDACESVIGRLVDHLIGDRLDTGILGTRYLLDVLSDHGHVDLALSVLTTRDYPSWGYWLEQGHRTLLESWELDARSTNHHMFGSVDQWLFSYLAGIRPTGPGFAQIRIEPHLPRQLTWCRCSVDTVRGRVAVRWERTNDVEALIEVAVPANARATVRVPGAVTVEPAPRDTEGHGVAFEVGSGNHRFVVQTE